jgi:hypothetical protein
VTRAALLLSLVDDVDGSSVVVDDRETLGDDGIPVEDLRPRFENEFVRFTLLTVARILLDLNKAKFL